MTFENLISDFMDILIIDDNLDITSLFSDILDSEGHSAKIVNQATEGLELIRKNEYSVIFLDISMPGLSGLDILEILDEDGILKTKKIVLFTAIPISNTEFEKWKNKGLYGLIRKPARLVQILEMLDSIKKSETLSSNS